MKCSVRPAVSRHVQPAWWGMEDLMQPCSHPTNIFMSCHNLIRNPRLLPEVLDVMWGFYPNIKINVLFSGFSKNYCSGGKQLSDLLILTPMMIV